MSSRKVIRGLTLMVVVGTYLSSTIARAQPDQQSGKWRGPPPQAIEACADQSEGAACSFSGRRGDVEGYCIVVPQEHGELACAPEGGPPKGREQQ